MKSVGRNEPCPCGSGKKYKKCCLGNVAVDEEVEKMAAFALPLVEATDGSPKQVERALEMAKLFWTLALVPDDAGLRRKLDEIVTTVFETEGDRAEFLSFAEEMIARHREMFPEMHGL